MKSYQYMGCMGGQKVPARRAPIKAKGGDIYQKVGKTKIRRERSHDTWGPGGVVHVGVDGEGDSV